jgi:hypothetical protein
MVIPCAGPRSLGGRFEEGVLDDVSRRERPAPGADPLGRCDSGPQSAGGVEVAAHRVEIAQRRREAEVVDPGPGTG